MGRSEAEPGEARRGRARPEAELGREARERCSGVVARIVIRLQSNQAGMYLSRVRFKAPALLYALVAKCAAGPRAVLCAASFCSR